jgi:hypothetical protein
MAERESNLWTGANAANKFPSLARHAPSLSTTFDRKVHHNR